MRGQYGAASDNQYSDKLIKLTFRLPAQITLLSGNSIGERFLYAGFIVLGKLPEAQGVLHYYLNKTLGKTSKIIEYKIDNKQDQESHSSLKD